MRQDKRLARLAVAAGLLRDRRAEELRRIEDAIAALRAEADALRARTAGPDDLLALRGEAAAAAARWDAWRQARLIALGREMAELSADREAARDAALRAFGKTLAIDRLRARSG